jgi:hypothetical protein
MPGWVLAFFLLLAALVPAGVYFTASFFGYTYSGYGTGALDAAPGPLVGAGLIPAAVVIGAAYRFFQRTRQRS